jgi:YVTN family beta-propeller protein
MTPRQVGRYRLDSLLGSGGTGEVYQAYDTDRDRHVALKLLPEALSADPEYLKRFQRETQVAARLREPHVIPIHGFGETGSQLFIDMRLVNGTDIGTLVRVNDRITPHRAVYLIAQVAAALDAAHAGGLVHRDIKPSNILVTSGDFVYVVDFGIARPVGDPQTALATAGTTTGTLHYTAPERFTGHEVDGRADVYSLACVLHECLTGAPPFTGSDRSALMYAQLDSTPPPASSLAEGVPPAMDAVIARGMAKDPKDRFATAGELAAAARQALLNGAAPPPPPMTERPATAPAETPAPELAETPATVPAPDMARDMSPGPGDGYPPPGDAPGGPRRAGRRRLGVLLLVLAALVAIPIVIVLAASSRPKPGAPGTPNKGATAGVTAEATTNVSGDTLPAVTGKILVGQTPSYIQVAPNGRFAYVTRPGAGVITVLNTATDRVAGTIEIPQGPPQSVSFSPDSRTAYVSVYSPRNAAVHLIAFIDTATRKVTSTVPVDNFTPDPSTTSPDGRYLYVPNHNTAMRGPRENVVDVIDTASRKLIAHIAVPANPHWVAYGKNGRIYTTDHMSARVTVINAATNSVITNIEVGETPHSEALSPDGSRLAVTSFDGNAVFLISTATDQMTATIPVGRNPMDIAYSPDGVYLYTVDNEDNAVTVIDTADNHIVGTVKTGKAPTSIALLPNGAQAYVTDENDGTVEILNLSH